MVGELKSNFEGILRHNIPTNEYIGRYVHERTELKVSKMARGYAQV